MLAKYDDEELHQLRVNLRRIRSALESLSTKKARRLRRDLGKLALGDQQCSGLDTLVACARSELTAGQFGELEPRLGARQAAARDEVYQLLGSRQWRTVVKGWDRMQRRPISSDDPGRIPGRV